MLSAVAVTGFKPTCEITIDSTKANKTKLDALIETIYGRDAGDGKTELTPTLPDPDDVLSAMAA